MNANDSGTAAIQSHTIAGNAKASSDGNWGSILLVWLGLSLVLTIYLLTSYRDSGRIEVAEYPKKPLELGGAQGYTIRFTILSRASHKGNWRSTDGVSLTLEDASGAWSYIVVPPGVGNSCNSNCSVHITVKGSIIVPSLEPRLLTGRFSGVIQYPSVS